LGVVARVYKLLLTAAPPVTAAALSAIRLGAAEDALAAKRVVDLGCHNRRLRADSGDQSIEAAWDIRCQDRCGIPWN